MSWQAAHKGDVISAWKLGRKENDERAKEKDQVHKNITACGDGRVPVSDCPGAPFICGI